MSQKTDHTHARAMCLGIQMGALIGLAGASYTLLSGVSYGAFVLGMLLWADMRRTSP